MKVKLLSRVRPRATPWTAAYQAPPPMGLSRQEYSNLDQSEENQERRTLAEKDRQMREKKGSCPKVDIAFPQLGLCRDQCQVDSQCSDLLKCCLNGCGKVSCVTPVF